MALTQRRAPSLPTWLAILLVSTAGLLLEVGYTRIVSFKLWYYYTYLVIGLSLLGIGSGGIFVALFAPLRRATTERIVALCSLWGAASIAVGYWVVARTPVDTVAIWDYGTGASFKNLALLAVICFALFATFVALGIIVSTILGRAGDAVGRLYFADLIGAGLGCVVAIPLIVELSPPQVIVLAAAIFGLVGLASLPVRSLPFALGAVLTVALVVGVTSENLLPAVRTEQTKLDTSDSVFSDWGPVFRVDVAPEVDHSGVKLLVHDGTYGSGIWRWDGKLTSLGRFRTNSRALPFGVLGDPPPRELIIGSAGGQEILGSLYFGARDIEAVELNPVTVSILRDRFADYTGHVATHPGVHLHQGDGRTYLARSKSRYDLVWFVAPDSYAATNAASSGAFVLSESYLYTTEMIQETLRHLTPGGIMVVQFGELSFERSPNRTARYVVTARDALERIGVRDPSRHMLVSASVTPGADLSTIILSRSPVTAAGVQRFLRSVGTVPDEVAVAAPGQELGDHLVTRLASGTDAQVRRIVDHYPKRIGVVADDAPFFWHFSGFDGVLRNITEPLHGLDPEQVIGERVLLLLLGIAMAYAAVFLLLPFLFVRRRWVALPKKGLSAVYFACLGLGFMFFEITMIQRLVQFLGFPSYSLTVTLASILVWTGIGALLSQRLAASVRHLMIIVLGVLAVLTVFYQFGLPPLMDSLQSASLAVRVSLAFVVLAPLGVCLGTFMPLGLVQVTRVTTLGEEYVAWSWAVNGFFSVIGSVLTTILSMSFGFRTVQFSALLVYAVAVAAYLRLRRVADALEPAAEPVADGMEVLATT